MLLGKYNEIIQEQLAEGIIEKVTDEPKGKKFYIPHKPVIRQSAESTKIRIVFDGSARANERSPSLNDSLETGPPLQNLLWNVLMRNWFKAVALAGDLKQAFLQIQIREEDRDSLGSTKMRSTILTIHMIQMQTEFRPVQHCYCHSNKECNFKPIKR